MKPASYLLFIFLIFIFLGTKKKEVVWKELDGGLRYAIFDAPRKSVAGDSKITVLQIDPKQYKFSLVSAKEKKDTNRTAKEWAMRMNLIAVINAGMFLEDGQTNTGYMKNFGFTNNPKLNSDNAITAFNPKDTTVAPAQIIDRECQDWNALKEKYNSFTQGIRMIDCKQVNKWAQQDKMWSMVVIGKDKKGNMLFIFTRSPYTVHDFIDFLLKLPIEIYNAQYLEGGPEASFYVKCKDFETEKFGSYETGFFESDKNDRAWRLPNVIGISKK